MKGLALVVGVVVIAMACRNAASPSPTTGLTGVVTRGPITPVCRVDMPCEAPFSAGFSIDQNGTLVTRFRSDTEGRFRVFLSPGSYRVVPDRDAPIIAPERQAKTVDVQPVGLTQVHLAFDTGIR